MRIILAIALLLIYGNVISAEENGERKGFGYLWETIEGRATISGKWAKFHFTGDVAGATYRQMSFPVVEGTSSVNTPGQSKGFPGFACTKYRLSNTRHDAYECFALINLRNGKLVDAVFSDAELEDDETEDRLTSWWDAQGNKSKRAADIPEVIKDSNSQEWIISEEIIEESGELEGFDYIRGKIFGRAIAVYGWMDSCLTGDAAEAIYYQMPLSIKDNAEHTDAQMRGFRGFVCTKYRQYDTEKHDYECTMSINLKEGVIDDHNLLCPKQYNNIYYKRRSDFQNPTDLLNQLQHSLPVDY